MWRRQLLPDRLRFSSAVFLLSGLGIHGSDIQRMQRDIGHVLDDRLRHRQCVYRRVGAASRVYV